MNITQRSFRFLAAVESFEPRNPQQLASASQVVEARELRQQVVEAIPELEYILMSPPIVGKSDFEQIRLIAHQIENFLMTAPEICDPANRLHFRRGS